MKISSKLIATSILALFTLSACSTNTVVNNQNIIQKSNIHQNYSISGVVQFNTYKSNFKTKAYEDEVTRKATVSVIYPSDYSDLNLRNTTVATGLTNAQGSFTISPNAEFTPEVNKVMILEATKRVNGVGNSISSLRTNIKWNGSAWVGISTPTNYINAKTTSLALISALNPNILSSSDSIGKLNSLDGTVSYDAKLTEGIFNWMLDAVGSVIYEFKDPAQEIFALSINGKAYTNSFNEKIINNMHTIQTITATYSVDHSGLYPNSAETLVQEAKSKGYWGNPKNPFADYETISATLPPVISYDDYIQAKSTLNLKGTVLENQGNLKGIVVYQPISNTLYKIYGVDIFGELIKINNKTTSSVYYLSNN